MRCKLAGEFVVCLQMATDMDNFDNRASSPSIIEGGQETSYIFVRGLGSGAFAEANLYRKTEVFHFLMFNN